MLRVFSETFAVVLFLRLWPVLVSLFREQAVVIIFEVRRRRTAVCRCREKGNVCSTGVD